MFSSLGEPARVNCGRVVSTPVRGSSAVQPAPQLVAVRDLATSERLAEQYALLRERGVHRQEDGWVVARPGDVAVALADPALRVAPAGPAVGEARSLQARMARFTDGPEHAGRRTVVEQLLPETAGLEPRPGTGWPPTNSWLPTPSADPRPPPVPAIWTTSDRDPSPPEHPRAHCPAPPAE